MIWFILGLLVIYLSFVLARKSLKNYQDMPSGENGLFLLRDLQYFDDVFLEKICMQTGSIFSLEKIYKGGQGALVLFAPKRVGEGIVGLSPLEIEDYTQKISEDRVQVWELNVGKKKGAKHIHFLEGANLTLEEQAAFQIVFMPGEKGKIQVSMRILVSASDALKRSNIAKQIDKNMALSNQVRSKRKFSSKQVFGHFRKRSLYPKEVSKQFLTPQELLKLIKQ